MPRLGLRARLFVFAVGLPMLVAIAWWWMTPAGIVGSLAGTSILTGALVLVVGLGTAGGMDIVLGNLLPGSNVGRMAEQGLTGEPRHLQPRPRWTGPLTMLAGAAYIAAGALLWSLR